MDFLKVIYMLTGIALAVVSAGCFLADWERADKSWCLLCGFFGAIEAFLFTFVL